MTQVSKPYTFSNGTTADATQVNQDFDTLYNDVDGQLDDTNMKTGGLSKAIAMEGVAPSQSIGLPYGIDVFGSTGFVLSGLTVTKDGTNLNQINVAAGVAYVLQSSGSANGQLRRLTPAATNYRTSAANSTYYLDLNPDGSYTWGGHSTQTGYITIATVTSDASSNVNVITDTRSVRNLISVLSGGTKVQSGLVSITGGAANTAYSANVTFPTAFSSTPIVVAGFSGNPFGNSTTLTISASSVSPTGFTVTVEGSGATTTYYVSWIAIGS